MSGATICGWVKIDDSASISYLISENVVEFDLTPRSGEVQLVTTEGGLEKLITAGSEALQALRARTEADADE
jgi:hypothetical protein